MRSFESDFNYETTLIRPPFEGCAEHEHLRMSPERALEWMRTDYPDFSALLGTFICDGWPDGIGELDRDAVYALWSDLDAISTSCVESIQANIPIAMCFEPDERRFDRLARLVTLGSRMGYAFKRGGRSERALRVLANELTRVEDRTEGAASAVRDRRSDSATIPSSASLQPMKTEESCKSGADGRI